MSIDSLITALFFVVFFGVSAFVLTKTWFFVGERNYANVERFRKYNRTVGSGIHFRIPLIEEVIEGTLREVRVDVKSVEVLSLDNVRVKFDIVIWGRIVDPYKASYGIVGLKDSIRQLVINVTQQTVPSITARELMVTAGRETVLQQINHNMDLNASSWGFDTTRVGIDSLLFTGEVQEAYESVVSASQRAEAQRIEAQGPAGAFQVILKAVGDDKALAKSIMEISALQNASKQGLLATYLIQKLFGSRGNDE